MEINDREYNMAYQAMITTIGSYDDMEEAMGELTKILWGADEFVETMLQFLDEPEHADSHSAAVKQFIKDAKEFFAKGLSREQYYQKCREI